MSCAQSMGFRNWECRIENDLILGLCWSRLGLQLFDRRPWSLEMVGLSLRETVLGQCHRIDRLPSSGIVVGLTRIWTCLEILAALEVLLDPSTTIQGRMLKVGVRLDGNARDWSSRSCLHSQSC